MLLCEAPSHAVSVLNAALLVIEPPMVQSVASCAVTAALVALDAVAVVVPVYGRKSLPEETLYEPVALYLKPGCVME